MSRQLEPHIPESILHFDIFIKPIPNKICINKCMDGAILLSLVSSLREFDAVYNLGSSTLKKLILDPSIKDYSIPITVQPTINTIVSNIAMFKRKQSRRSRYFIFILSIMGMIN